MKTLHQRRDHDSSELQILVYVVKSRLSYALNGETKLDIMLNFNGNPLVTQLKSSAAYILKYNKGMV